MNASAKISLSLQYENGGEESFLCLQITEPCDGPVWIPEFCFILLTWPVRLCHNQGTARVTRLGYELGRGGIRLTPPMSSHPNCQLKIPSLQVGILCLHDTFTGWDRFRYIVSAITHGSVRLRNWATEKLGQVPGCQAPPWVGHQVRRHPAWRMHRLPCSQMCMKPNVETIVTGFVFFSRL